MRKYNVHSIYLLFFAALFIISLSFSKPASAAETGNWIKSIDLSQKSFAYNAEVKTKIAVTINEDLITPPKQGDKAIIQYQSPKARLYGWCDGSCYLLEDTLLTYNEQTKKFEGTLDFLHPQQQSGTWKITFFKIEDTNFRVDNNKEDAENTQDLSMGDFILNGPAGGWYAQYYEWYFYNTEKQDFQTGWVNSRGKWYYLDPKDFSMHTGWIDDNGKWYYLSGSGSMVTGWQFLYGPANDGKNTGWYYFYKSGAMCTGWLYESGKWYYLYESGRMATGWEKIIGKWYYLNGNGTMEKGWKYVNGKWYMLKNDGSMAVNTWVGDYWVDSRGAWTKTR